MSASRERCPMHLWTRAGTITIAAAADVGEAQTEVEAAIEGDSVQISFNARYLQEALQSLDQISWRSSSGPPSPGVLKPTTSDEDYVHVIMPVRTPSRSGAPTSCSTVGRREAGWCPDTHDARHPSRPGHVCLYGELDVEFPKGPQVVVGPNAAGKTNLVESLVVLGTGHPIASRWTAS